MIDETAAREYIMDMNKKGLNNLLLALKIEQELIMDTKRNDVDIKYSPLTSTLLIHCKNTPASRLQNVVALIKRLMPSKAKSIVHSGAKESFAAVRMTFGDDFNIIIQHMGKGEENGTV